MLEQPMALVWMVWLACGFAAGVIFLLRRRTTRYDIFFGPYILGAFALCALLGPIALAASWWTFLRRAR